MKLTKKELLKKLEKIHKILHTHHSQIKLVEIGRQNVLNDIDNEIDLDGLIKKLNKEVKYGKRK